MSDWLGIKGQVAVVTGAGGGIGRQIAVELAAAGCRVAAVDMQEKNVAQTVADVQAAGGEATAIACNIADPDSVRAARSRCESIYGTCSILVNNAAILRPGAMANLALKDWNDLINVNLTGYFICSQVFGEAMMKQHMGSIVHVASLAGLFPQGFSGAYSVSKAGVMMMSKNLATEWGEFGIRSNVVSPAMVQTPLTEVIYADPAVKAQREKVVPVRRIGRPRDIANAVVFLSSERASYISGQDITVDGGWSANMLGMVPRPGYDKAAAEKV